MRDENIPQLADMLRESLANGRRPRLAITSNSMSPLLRVGDQIILADTPLSQLNPGDIITIETDQHLLTHRFWFNQNTSLITRGDRCLDYDPPVRKEKYIGRAIIRKRNGKYLKIETGFGKWLNDHLSWLVVLESKLFSGSPLQTNPVAGRWQGRPAQLQKWFHLWGRFISFLVEIVATNKLPDG